MMSEVEAKEIERLQQFSNEAKDDVLYVDGSREVPESTVCRRFQSGGQSCLRLRLASTKMFEQMQNMGYFCILPQDTTKTEMECKKI